MCDHRENVDRLFRARDELIRELPPSIAALADDPCVFTARIPNAYRDAAEAIHEISRRLMNLEI